MHSAQNEGRGNVPDQDRILRLLALVALSAAIFCGSAAGSNRSTVWRVSRAVFGPHAATAFCIAGFETGFSYSPYAVSPTNDHGTWQIHAGLQTYGRRIYDVWFNARVAYRMSRGGTDWSPWTVHWRCGV